MTEAKGLYLRASLIFAAMTAVFFWPVGFGYAIAQSDVLFFIPPWTALRPLDLISPSNTFLNDQTLEFLTFFHVARQSLGRWELPLWNPYIMGGTGLLANGQSGVLYPLNLGHYLLPPPWGFTVSALLKTFLAALGTFALARGLRIGFWGAIIAGTAYAFSQFQIFWLNHPHTNVTWLFPLLLLATRHAMAVPGRRRAAWLALIVGLQLLGGHVELSFFTAVAAGIYALYLQGMDKGRGGASLGTFFGGYALGTALAAVMVLPFLAFLYHSATWEVRSSDNPFFLKPRGLGSLLLPYFHAFIKPHLMAHDIVYASLSLYVGVLPPLLAFCALRKPWRQTAFFLSLMAFGLFMVFHVEPVFTLVTQLPLFRQAPGFYLVIYAILALSILAGRGWDALGERRSWWMFVGYGLLAASGFSLAWRYFGALDPPAVQAFWRLVAEYAVLFALGLGVVLSMGRRWFSPWAGGLAAGLVFVDLWLAGSGWNPALSPSHAFPRDEPPAIAFLKEDPEPFRILALDGILQPNTASLADLEDIQGYDVPVSLRYHAFFKERLAGHESWWIHTVPRFEEDSLPFLSLLNVKYILARSTLPPPLVEVYRDDDVVIHRNPKVFPRAFLVHRAEGAGNLAEAMERVKALGWGLREKVVIEGVAGGEAASSQGEAVRIVSRTSQSMVIEVHARHRGWLVLSQSHDPPGWRAFIDGKQVPLYRANVMLSALPVEAGEHVILLHYFPWTSLLGLAISGMAAVMVAWWIRPGSSS